MQVALPQERRRKWDRRRGGGKDLYKRPTMSERICAFLAAKQRNSALCAAKAE
jgi:hypothetical protein